VKSISDKGYHTFSEIDLDKRLSGEIWRSIDYMAWQRVARVQICYRILLLRKGQNRKEKYVF
jgi:hypothetical protein